MRTVAASFTLFAAIAAVGAFVSSCATFGAGRVETRTVEVTPEPPAPYTIGRDDVLSVIVWKEPQLSGDVTVADDGTITVPLAGRVKAAGLTTDQVRADLTKELSHYIHAPNVTVRVANPSSRVFYVLGQVRAPGVYPLHAGEVLSQALAQAGGLSDFANARAVRIVRRTPGKDVEMTVNYKRVRDDGDLKDDVALRAGDTITVP